MTLPDLYALPTDLPRPIDDGACAHLPGHRLPSLTMPSTAGRQVDLADLAGTTVVFVYPMTGTPGVALPDGWDAIPGARGCTPQACSFRDHIAEFSALGVNVFGLSTQRPDEQAEAATRLHLPFELLSDDTLAWATALKLPTFDAGGRPRLRRVTLIVTDGRIETAFYPVFPPDRSADAVLAWLRHRS